MAEAQTSQRTTTTAPAKVTVTGGTTKATQSAPKSKTSKSASKPTTREDKVAGDHRIQSEHDADAGKGDTSLSVLGHTSASVYDRRDPVEDEDENDVTARQEGRSSSAHAVQDVTTLSTMGDTSESVYDRADDAEGYVGGVQADENDELPEEVEQLVEQPEGDVPRVGETEQETELPK